MGPLDALWHLVNFFVPALGMALIAPGLAKLLWRRELAGVAWRRLAQGCAGAGSAALVAGLLLTGHDGRMLTYGLLVLSVAATLWWLGFGPGRRG